MSSCITRFARSRLVLATSLFYAALLPAAQARCFFRDDDDDDDDDDRRWHCGLSTGARIGIGIGVAVFVIILIVLSVGMYQRRSSSRQVEAPSFVAVPINSPPPGPAPAFFAPPPGPPPGPGGFVPQTSFASQAPLSNGAGQFVPPPGSLLDQQPNASGSSGEAPPVYMQPPGGAPFVDKSLKPAAAQLV